MILNMVKQGLSSTEIIILIIKNKKKSCRGLLKFSIYQRKISVNVSTGTVTGGSLINDHIGLDMKTQPSF